MGHTEICKLLLAAGADIEQREQGGRTPLYIAARGSFTAIVDMIIKTARLDYPAHVSTIATGKVATQIDRTEKSQQQKTTISNLLILETLLSLVATVFSPEIYPPDKITRIPTIKLGQLQLMPFTHVLEFL
jgi:ankyrin repeat protein